MSLMKVEKVPNSTYEEIGGCDKQVKEIKEVIELPIKHPELFEALGIAQPKGVLLVSVVLEVLTNGYSTDPLELVRLSWLEPLLTTPNVLSLESLGMFITSTFTYPTDLSWSRNISEREAVW